MKLKKKEWKMKEKEWKEWMKKNEKNEGRMNER